MTQKKQRRFSGDVSVNLLFSLAPILLTLVSVPLYLNEIGLERYGVLTLVFLLTGMFAFFDLGMGSVTTYLVARTRSGEDGPSIGSVVRTTGAINLVLGCLLALLFWFAIGPLAFGTIEADANIAAEIDASLIWITILLPVSLLTAIFRNALDGQRRFVTVNLIGTTGQMATVLAALSTAYFVGPALPQLVLAILVVRAVVLAVYIWVVAGDLKDSRFMTRTELLGAARFGGWQTVFSGLSGVMGSADRFIIGWISGAAATALYAIPFGLTSRLRILSQAVLRSLYPKLSEASSEEIRRDLGSRALIGMLAAMAVITIPAILVVKPFFSAWIGPEFEATAGRIAQVLIVAAYVQAAMRVVFVFQRAAGRPDLAAKLRIVSTLPYLGLLAALTWQFGAFGAAMALLLRFLAEFSWVIYVSELRDRVVPIGVGFLGICGVAILLTEIGYGLWSGLLISVITGVGLLFVAAKISEDVAQLIRRLLPMQIMGKRT